MVLLKKIATMLYPESHKLIFFSFLWLIQGGEDEEGEGEDEGEEGEMASKDEL